MIAFSLIFGGILFATLIPEFIALYLVSSRFVSVRYLAAAAVGLTFWFFFDTIGGAVSLDSNYSIYPIDQFGGWPHVGLILAFALGIAVLAMFDHYALTNRKVAGDQPRSDWRLFLIPAGLALVMGLHSLGEGWDASSAVAAAQINSGSVLDALTQAFGSIPAVISYPIHKFLEAVIIGAVYAAFVSGSGQKPARWHIPVLVDIFATPSVLGATLGYYISFDTSYFYAFGVTSAMYAVLRLVEATNPAFKSGAGPSVLGSKTFIAMAGGFFLLYFAALLH